MEMAIERKPRKPRGRDYSLAIHKYSEEIVEEFNRVWGAWPVRGWNFSTKSESPRRMNYDASLDRFAEVVVHNEIMMNGKRLNAHDLAEIAISYAARRIKETPGVPPICCCIENFFSCIEGKKHPWKEELMNMRQ